MNDHLLAAGSLARMACVCWALLACGPADAHHSYADFDANQTVSLTGAVESYDWANPHVSFKMMVTEPVAQSGEWTIETHGPSILKNYGWSAATLKVGMPVQVACNPKRDGSRGCRLHTLLLMKTGQTLETKLSRAMQRKAQP